MSNVKGYFKIIFTFVHPLMFEIIQKGIRTENG